jgi:hypothetical protein
MSKETENILRFAGLIAVFIFIIGVALFRIRGLEKELDKYKNAPADTTAIIRHDTIPIDNPTLIEQYESENEKVAIEVRRLRKQLAEALNQPADTIHDTTEKLVFLPREYMVYKDSTYRAVVSGVQPRLDSLEIYRPTITQTITKTVVQKKKTRWGIGLQAGYGFDGKKLRPYVGAGVQYNLISW